MQADDQAKNYTLHYATWHTHDERHQEDMNRFYSSVFSEDLERAQRWLNKPAAHIEVLDFGCGMGFFLNHLRSLGFVSVQGFELDAGQAGSARKYGLNVEQSANPLQWLKQCDKKFDLIFSIDVLEHISPDSLQEFLVAIRSCLSDDGIFIATVPNANSTCAGRWRYIDWTHRTSFTEHSLSHVMKLSGLQVESISPSEIFRLYTKPQSRLRQASEHLILKVIRSWRRLELIGEFGWDEGIDIPITTNIKVRAFKHARAGQGEKT
jgi:2-polyprenyl-3-methyl-5-hydroxy-6-metoxy-1,4-benzoquinol methylase